MTLSSIIFVFGFFPIFLLAYYICKDRYRDYVLLAGSIYFYYVTDVYRTKYVIALCAAVYILTWLMDKLKNGHPTLRKILAIDGISGTLVLLFHYRYLNCTASTFCKIFGIEKIWQRIDSGVPLGLSFLTFSIISYIADCYTGKIQYQKDPFKLATYILMFPKIIMGPIERYSNIEKNLIAPDVSIENVGIGVKRFIIGFCKKVIIADNLAVLVGTIQTGVNYPAVPISVLWLGSISYSLELLFDFAGYSDMAIGIAKMLGFHFAENFNYPYIADSLTDFWRRWHISLSFWFRDYVYIPLGGSRKSLFRNIINLFIVWLLTGLWHGGALNFVLWGMVYFCGIIFERYILKLKDRGPVIKFIWRIITLLIINFDWVLFSHKSWHIGLIYLKGMLGIYGNPLSDYSFVYDMREYGIYLILGIIFSMPVVPWLSKKFKKQDKFGISTVAAPLALAFALIWAISFIMLGAHNPFLYQQF